MPVQPLSRFTVLPLIGADNANGLISWWPVTQGSDRAEDFSGSANIGLPTGTPLLADGPFSIHAITINGSTTYFRGQQVINVARASISLWMNIPSNPVGLGFLGGCVDGIGSGTYDKILAVGSTGKIRFQAFDGGVVFIDTIATVGDAKWHHIVGVVDGTNISIYVDGKLDGSNLAGNTFTGFTVPNLFLGGSTNLHVAQTFSAFDFRFYNRALSAMEINSIYNDSFLVINEYELPVMFLPAAGGDVLMAQIQL